MTKEQLHEKMDQLGKLMFEWEQFESAKEKFNAKMFDDIIRLRKEIAKEIRLNRHSEKSFLLEAVYRDRFPKWMTDCEDVTFILRDEGWEDDGR